MKKKLQKYLSGEREGFSLVELIIVIAIMAILIGIIALAVIPYLEKSRVGKDQQTVDTVYSAFQTTLADQQVTQDATVTIKGSGGATGTGAADADFLLSLAEALNCTSAANMNTIEQKLVSKNAVNKDIVCTFDAATKKITVTAGTDIKSSNQE